MSNSDVATFTYSVKVATPTASIASGTVVLGTQLALSCTTNGATIRFTTDGSLPTATTGNIYSAPITINSNTTIKAIAYKSSMTDSDVATFTYSVNAATPTANYQSGTVETGTQVILTSTTTGSIIRYTTDGTLPTSTTGTIYSMPIMLTTNTIIKAIAYKSGMSDSDVAAFTYIVLSRVNAPISNLASSTVDIGTQLSLSTSTSNAIIRYTVDGSTPSSTVGILYTNPITLSGYTTIKVIAYKDGMIDSNVVSFSYNVKLLPPKASISEGFVLNNTQVTLSCDTISAVIRYTIDGSTPTSTTGLVYSTPIILTTNTTIKAIAYKSGIINSNVIAFTYTVLPSEITFKKNLGGSGNDVYKSVTTLNDGYIAVGYSASASFGNGDWIGVTGKGINDAIIVKYDTGGNVVWKKNFGGSDYDLYNSVIAVNDGYIVVGYSSSASFGNGDWIGVTGKGLSDAIIVKYDLSGNIVWKKHFGGSDTECYNSVSAVNDGYIAVGYAWVKTFGSGDWIGVTGNDYDNSIIVKYDMNGNVVWKKNFGDSSWDHYESVTAVNDGYIAVGYSASFGNGDWAGITGKGATDAVIVKYAINGNVLWKKNFGGADIDVYQSITAVDDGYIAVGYSASTSFGNGDWIGTTKKGLEDAIIVKYDTSGNIMWKKNFGGSDDDTYMSLTAVSDGYIAVGYSGPASFGNGDWVGATGKGSNDAIVVKYDINGNLVWKKNFGSSSDDLYESVATVNNGYIVVGYSTSFVNGDWKGVTGKGSYDSIIVKYKDPSETMIKPLFNNSYGIYSDTTQLNLFPQSSGTYTVKAQYFNTTGKILNASFLVAIKSNNKLLKTYIIPTQNIAIDGVVDISKDIELPSQASTPNLEVKIMAFDSFLTLAPLSNYLTLGR